MQFPGVPPGPGDPHVPVRHHGRGRDLDQTARRPSGLLPPRLTHHPPGLLLGGLAGSPGPPARDGPRGGRARRPPGPRHVAARTNRAVARRLLTPSQYAAAENAVGPSVGTLGVELDVPTWIVADFQATLC